MSTVDPDQSPLDPDTGLPAEPIPEPDAPAAPDAPGTSDPDGGDTTSTDPVGDDARDEVADGAVLADPDIDLDDTPRGADDLD